MQTIIDHFPEVSEKQIQQFQKLGELYPEWNEKINVISRKDIQFLYTRHILHSLAIAKYTSFNSGETILDVGTGGGFPGIPLAIMFPEASFLLVDSIGKKIRVVNEIVLALGLNNVTAQHERAEKIKGSFDFVVSRAVTELSRFIPWVRNKIKKPATPSKKNGILYLKGGDIQQEIATIQYPSKSIPLTTWFSDPFFESKVLVHIEMNN